MEALFQVKCNASCGVNAPTEEDPCPREDRRSGSCGRADSRLLYVVCVNGVTRQFSHPRPPRPKYVFSSVEILARFRLILKVAPARNVVMAR